METPQLKLMVTEPKGTDLCREPGRNPKPEHKDNIILKIPSGSPLTLESHDLKVLDGHEWVFVGYESEGRREEGWVLGDDVIPDGFSIPEGGFYIVNAPDGIDFRMEPNGNPQTEEGTDNVIVRVPAGAPVTVIKKRTMTTNGEPWGLAMYMTEAAMMFGWVLIDESLSTYSVPLAGNTLSGGVSASYTFYYEGIRTISKTNLESVVGSKLSANQLTDSQFQIELDRPFNNLKKYWTSRENLKHITLTPPVT